MAHTGMASMSAVDHEGCHWPMSCLHVLISTNPSKVILQFASFIQDLRSREACYC